MEQNERKLRVMRELEANPFRAPWWLRGGHAQSVYSPFFRPRSTLEPQKERWQTPDGDFLDLYFQEGRPGKPRLLLLHGLEGCARSHYILGLMEGARRIGWSATSVEWRSCGGEMNRAPRLYHSGETTDLAFVVDRLNERRSDERLFVVGYSLGGNVLAKWLGEGGKAIPSAVAGAACVCPPFDLVASGPQLDRALGGLYSKWFFRTLLPKARAKSAQYPEILDYPRIAESRGFADFDTYATAALHGFEDAMDYWGRVRCGQFLGGVRRPLLLIAAEDDPFNPASAHLYAQCAQSPWLHGQFTERGGHCGFIYGANPQRPKYWAEEQILRFFCAYAGLS